MDGMEKSTDINTVMKIPHNMGMSVRLASLKGEIPEQPDTAIMTADTGEKLRASPVANCTGKIKKSAETPYWWANCGTK